MRKNNIKLRILFFMLLSMVMIKTNAQIGLNFQGVARTSNNVILASQAITIKLSILQGSATGTADYIETRKVTTNAQGLFTAVIGDTGAISTLGNFTTINWKLTPKFLKIEMDPAAGSNFVTMGTTQFQYVAYAQFAKSVDAENIVGIVPVTLGGTGVNSLTGLKTALTLNNVNNTTDLTKPISTLTQTALDLKFNAADTIKYTKQTYSDSALLTKLKLSDTASMLSNRIGKDTLNLSARINLKANMSDLTTGLALKLNATDTSKYTKQTYADSALLTKLKLSDTASMLSNRIGKDTLNLSARINLKANSSDMTSGLLLKENALNKSTATDLGGTTPSDILFPTQKAVKDYVTANNSGGGVADGGITTIKLSDGAVTDAKINTVSGSKVIGNITGNAATATLATTATTAGNITATSNKTLTTLSNLTSVGTITTGTWSGTEVAITNGGTGATTAATARTNLGLVIGTDVQAPLVAGTDYLVPTGSAASLTNFPTFNQSTTGNAATATTAGNITATTNTTLTSLSSLATVGTITSGVWSGTEVAIANGGTGATTASAARTNLGLEIGTNVQAPLTAGTDYLTPTGSAASLTNFPTFNQSTTGNAATATLAGNITATSNTTITSLSNLSSVGTITSGVWSGTAVAVEKGGTGLTSPGTNGNVLTSNGTAWISAAPSGARTHTLGEAFGGGIIFYVTSDGLHGLIAETQNLLSKCFWMDAQNEISKSSNHSTAGKLFSDWRLPTANELDLLLTYNSATGLIPGLNSWYYWSSTEASSTIVRIQGYPSLDKTAFGLKYGTDLYEARPIRAF
jgi:hypothetical protein